MSLTIFNKRDKVYILSPHIDDAIWSLGGLILELKRNNIEVNVITIFSNSSYANGELLDPAVATKIRKTEDSRALKLAGADQCIYLDYDEAVIRGVSLANLVDRFYAPSAKMINHMQEDLLSVIPSNSILCVPAAIGDNVDHLCVRLACNNLTIGKIYYYEDLPYAARNVRISPALKFLNDISYARSENLADQGLIKEHIMLYNVYKSQVKSKHIKQIEDYLLKNGYGIWVRNEK